MPATTAVYELIDDLTMDPVPVHLPGNAQNPKGWTVTIDPMAWSEMWSLRVNRFRIAERALMEAYRADDAGPEPLEEARQLLATLIVDILATHPANTGWTAELVLERCTVTVLSRLLNFFQTVGISKAMPTPLPTTTPPTSKPSGVRASRIRSKNSPAAD